MLAGIIRVAEQLERSRDQSVRELSVRTVDGKVVLEASADEDDAVAIWSARRAADLLSRAIGRPVEVEPA